MDDWFRRHKRTLRRTLAIALLIVLGISALRYADKIRKPSRDGTLTKSAFLRWRGQILALDAGEDIYQKYQYPNPPVQALILLPLTRLSPIPGAMTWFTLKVIMAVVSWWWAYRLTVGTGGRLSTISLFIAILFTLHPVLGDLSHGNVNIFIAFLVFASLECLRRRLDFSAGLVIALAVACKVTPALFVPYFVWKRLWWAVAGSCLGCVLWLAIVPGIALGFQHNRDLTMSWYETMVRPFLVEGKVNGEHANQSLPGLVTRLLTETPSDTEYDEGGDHVVAKEFHNVADIGRPGAKRVIRVWQLGYTLLGIWLLRNRIDRVTDPRSGIIVAAEYSFIILGMLLFSERTWKHHGVVLMLPFLVSATFYAARSTGSRLRAGLAVANILAFLLIAAPSLLGGDRQDEALAYGSHTLVFLIFFTQICIVLAQATHNASRSPTMAPITAPPTDSEI